MLLALIRGSQAGEPAVLFAKRTTTYQSRDPSQVQWLNLPRPRPDEYVAWLSIHPRGEKEAGVTRTDHCGGRDRQERQPQVHLSLPLLGVIDDFGPTFDAATVLYLLHRTHRWALSPQVKRGPVRQQVNRRLPPLDPAGDPA